MWSKHHLDSAGIICNMSNLKTEIQNLGQIKLQCEQSTFRFELKTVYFQYVCKKFVHNQTST